MSVLLEIAAVGIIGASAAAIAWFILEFITSVNFRRMLSDMVHATLTSVATSINVNTQYLTDALIKLAQMGHAERLEHLRMSQMLVNEVYTTTKIAVTLDMIKDMVKTLEVTGESR